MATVTLVISDGKSPGTINVKLEFEPEVKAGEIPTTAQAKAVEFLEFLKNGSDAPKKATKKTKPGKT